MTVKNAALFGAGLVLGAALMAGGDLVTAGQAAAKNTSTVVLENDRVRVVDARFVPGDEHPGMHTHEYPHVGVIIDGGTLELRSPDGSVETLELARGGVGYREANVTHEGVNRGKTPIRVIEVEIK